MIRSFSHACGDSKINLSFADRVTRADEIQGSTLIGLSDSESIRMGTRSLRSVMCSEWSFSVRNSCSEVGLCLVMD